MTVTSLLVATASGAALGSAAGVALTRWPLGERIGRPARSHCEKCGDRIAARDLVPILSWVVLRGRCRSCGWPIDVRLLVLEVSAALLVLGVVLVHGTGPVTVLLAIGVVGVLLAAFTDVADRIVPDRLTIPLAAIGLVGMLVLARDPGARSSVIGWGLGVPVLLEGVARVVIALGRPRPIGGGDVKLFAGLLALSLNSASGPQRLITLSLFLGGVHAVIGLVSGRLQFGDRVPFAPFMALGFVLVVLTPDGPMLLDGLAGRSW